MLRRCSVDVEGGGGELGGPGLCAVSVGQSREERAVGEWVHAVREVGSANWVELAVHDGGGGVRWPRRGPESSSSSTAVSDNDIRVRSRSASRAVTAEMGLGPINSLLGVPPRLLNSVLRPRLAARAAARSLARS